MRKIFLSSVHPPVLAAGIFFGSDRSGGKAILQAGERLPRFVQVRRGSERHLVPATTCTDGQVLSVDASEKVVCIDAPTGGGAADGNDYADSLVHDVTGTTLTTTLGRTGALIDLTATATLPSGGGTADGNDYVEAAAMGVQGTELTLILSRTGVLPDLTAMATLPAGGGTGTASVVGFVCVLEDVATTAYAAATQFMNCAAAGRIDRGGFTVEAASATDTTHRIVVPVGEGGLYEIMGSAFAADATSTRSLLHLAFSIERGGTTTVLPDEGSGYLRDGTGVDKVAVDHTSIVVLQAGDRIGVTVRSELAAAQFSITGAKSFFALLKSGGAQGPQGPQGPAGHGRNGRRHRRFFHVRRPDRYAECFRRYRSRHHHRHHWRHELVNADNRVGQLRCRDHCRVDDVGCGRHQFRQYPHCGS